MRARARWVLAALALAGVGCKQESAPAIDAGVASPGGPSLCEHGVPGDQCTACNPDLVATFKELGDWCAG
ncbi:MAG: efflux RND transporter periplasmic adaptor subunit, partial [Myxococcaceae bacterium]